MADRQHRKPLGTMIRQSDGKRFGIFGNGDIQFPFLRVAEDKDGGFDFATAERVPFAEAFALRQQIARSAGTH